MPVKQSASRDEFLKALGLDISKPDDKARLQQMWEEVTGYWASHFETQNRSILKPEYAQNAGVTRPYKWGHLDPTFIDNSIEELWKQGRPSSRYYYDVGRSDDRRVYNWVLKWLLWHVCRYRDWRNRKSKTTGSTSAAGPSSQMVTVQAASDTNFPPHDYWSTVMN